MDSPINRIQIIKVFPNLINDKSWKVTSKDEDHYNCIAWAAEDMKSHWWPHVGTPGVYWPPNIPVDRSISNFVRLFESLGYYKCSDDKFYKGIQKIAIYGIGNNCTHASRLKEDGMWTSKLGKSFDIEHSTPYGIEGIAYGTVQVLMERGKGCIGKIMRIFHKKTH